MAMRIGNQTIPASIASSGKYTFPIPVRVEVNGYGHARSVGGYRLEWEWRSMSFADYDWWVNRIGAGNESIALGNCTLVNSRTRQEVDYSHCVVYQPEHDGIIGTRYQSVKIRIEAIY